MHVATEMRGAIRPPSRQPQKSQHPASSMGPRYRASLLRNPQPCTSALCNVIDNKALGNASPRLGRGTSEPMIALRPSNVANSSSPEPRTMVREMLRKDVKSVKENRLTSQAPRSRPASAAVTRPPSVEDNHLARAARRRPPHVQALLNSRAALAHRARAAPHIDSEADAARALVRCRSAAVDLKQALNRLLSLMDFAVLDHAVAAHGDEVLDNLRGSLYSLHVLSSSFFSLACTDHETSFVEQPRANAPNAIAAKTFLVSLRAISEKMPTKFLNCKATTLELSDMIEQGLVEQILSWSAEVLAIYGAMHHSRATLSVRPASRAFAIQNLGRGLTERAKPQGRGGGSLPTSLAGSIKFAKDIGSLPTSLPGSFKSTKDEEFLYGKHPVCRSDTESVGSSDNSPVFTRTQSENSTRRRPKGKERMQYFRPPSILIPETSFEKKLARRQ